DRQANKEEVQAATELLKGQEEALGAEDDKLKQLQLLDPLSQVSRAQADVAGKQARLDQAKYALDQCTLKAPFAGKVMRVLVSKGDWLVAQPQQPTIQLCPLGPRIVRAEVEQEFANRVAVGQTALVQDDTSAGPT